MKTHREKATIAAALAASHFNDAWDRAGGTGDQELREAEESSASDIYYKTYPTELVKAAREFVRKVECGEARSERLYAAFKAALALYDDKETK